MDLCIKTVLIDKFNRTFYYSFNPCFNGSMYKNGKNSTVGFQGLFVSILVLMDLCIKTDKSESGRKWTDSFNPCFNGSMYKN